jgi:hypothetical protein
MNKYLGVRYVYDESACDQDSTRSEAFTLTQAYLACLPADWLVALHHDTIDADLNLMLSLIAQIHEQHQPLANTLAHLGSHFHFETLLSLTQPRAI